MTSIPLCPAVAQAVIAKRCSCKLVLQIKHSVRDCSRNLLIMRFLFIEAFRKPEFLELCWMSQTSSHLSEGLCMLVQIGNRDCRMGTPRLRTNTIASWLQARVAQQAHEGLLTEVSWQATFWCSKRHVEVGMSDSAAKWWRVCKIAYRHGPCWLCSSDSQAIVLQEESGGAVWLPLGEPWNFHRY